MSVVFGFFKLIPMWFWAALAVGIAVVVGIHAIEDIGYQRGKRETTAQFQPQIDKLRNDIEAERARYRSEIADWVVKGSQDRETLTVKLQMQATQIEKDAQDAKARIRGYVTDAANRQCIVPAGFVLFVNDGAARTNGAATGSAEPTAEVANTPSGRSLADVAGLVRDTQTALQQCRDQVLGWQEFWESVRARWDTLKAALQQKT